MNRAVRMRAVPPAHIGRWIPRAAGTGETRGQLSCLRLQSAQMPGEFVKTAPPAPVRRQVRGAVPTKGNKLGGPHCDSEGLGGGRDKGHTVYARPGSRTPPLPEV